MKRLLICLFTNICCICVFAQMQRYNPNFQIRHIGSSYQQPVNITQPPKNNTLFSLWEKLGGETTYFCDTIPIEIEDNQVYVRVLIDGQSYRFNIDTGSSQGMLFPNAHRPSAIHQLSTPLGNIVSRDANYHLDTVRVVQLPPFRIPLLNNTQQPTPNTQELEISHYVASLMPRPALNNKYDAIIGFDLFNRGLCAKIDAGQGIMILTNNRRAFQEEERQGYTVKYKLKWFVPYLLVSPFVRHTDEALFDLGSQQLYTMNKQSYDQHLEDDLSKLNKNLGADIQRQTEGHAFGQLAIAGHGAEKKDEVAFLRLDRLKFADFAFRDLRAITTQGASRIGAEILNYGAIIINPFRRQISFLPYNNTDNIEVSNKPFQVAFVPTSSQRLSSPHGAVAVGLIWEKSEVYKAGMRQGDIILQIDQQPILSFRDFTQFRFVRGESHRFRMLDSNGKEKIVECVIKP